MSNRKKGSFNDKLLAFACGITGALILISGLFQRNITYMLLGGFMVALLLTQIPGKK